MPSTWEFDGLKPLKLVTEPALEYTNVWFVASGIISLFITVLVLIFVEYSVKFTDGFGRNVGNAAGKIRIFQTRTLYHVWRSHAYDYKECCRLGPEALSSGRYVTMFRCNVLLVHSVPFERCHLFIEKRGDTYKKIARFTCPYKSCRDVSCKSARECFPYIFSSVKILVVLF